MAKLSQRKRKNPGGRAYIKAAWRPVYEFRTIRRGKNKGLFEATYMAGYREVKRRGLLVWVPRYARAVVTEIKLGLEEK